MVKLKTEGVLWNKPHGNSDASKAPVCSKVMMLAMSMDLPEKVNKMKISQYKPEIVLCELKT